MTPLSYKGYLGSIEFGPDERLFFGELEYIRLGFSVSQVNSLSA